MVGLTAVLTWDATIVTIRSQSKQPGIGWNRCILHEAETLCPLPLCASVPCVRRKLQPSSPGSTLADAVGHWPQGPMSGQP